MVRINVADDCFTEENHQGGDSGASTCLGCISRMDACFDRGKGYNETKLTVSNIHTQLSDCYTKRIRVLLCDSTPKFIPTYCHKNKDDIIQW